MLTLDGVTPPRNPGKASRVISFTQPYLFALASSIGLFTVGWTTWRGRAVIVDMCRQLGYRYGTKEPELLPGVAADSLVPADTKFSVSAVDSIDGNVTERELLTLSQLVAATAPEALFEIGTFDGRTTLNLALNAGPAATVHTLDLPAAEGKRIAAPLHPHERRYVHEWESGGRFRGTVAENRIVQLYGDSGTFDFSPYDGAMDFVFVDGSHAYAYVVSDSLNALRMLRSRGGMIVWHDYGRWDGVTRALNDLRKHHTGFAELVRLKGTTLAALRT